MRKIKKFSYCKGDLKDRYQYEKEESSLQALRDALHRANVKEEDVINVSTHVDAEGQVWATAFAWVSDSDE